ncbi:hypothetical protein ASG29_10210 [Sphingomonas sp. Leaf412]|uniref:hypothetical protein n=1 Tax=Sphingomonas sp. Leaf412 TaxID=1736370 RepID=UPI0006FC496C|nr:hypothetical protein [Sphingomonas sp. Leaf412]KQT32198.1 hypothetical protein ASG29_10210 [Sphingomonas sp. Leaf412]
MLILALTLQVAAAATPAPQRFSILVPVADQQCTRTRAPDEIVVCADALPSQELPLPAEAVSSRPVPVNRDMTGTGALNAARTPCAARVGGCQVGLDMFGMGTALIRGVQKLVAPNSCCEEPGEATSAGKLVVDALSGAGRLGKGKPDRTGRVPIDLDEPVMTGRVAP